MHDKQSACMQGWADGAWGQERGEDVQVASDCNM